MTAPLRVHLFYNSVADGAVLSGGSWQGAMPLARMQTEDLTDIARSTSLNPASTRFNITLDTVRAARGIMFGPTNMTARAQFRVARTDATFTEDVFDAGWQRFGTRVPFGTLPYGAPHTYDGFVPWSDPDRLPWAICVLPQRIGSRYWRVEIDDQANPDGYIDIGRLYVWDAFVPSINYAYGNNGLSLVDGSISSKAVGGNKRFWRLPNKRRWQGQLDVLPEDEAFSAFWAMINLSGFDRECFVVPNPGDTANMQARSFAGRLFQIDPIAQAYFRRASAGFGIEEL
jgi:hypothetical protein